VINLWQVPHLGAGSLSAAIWLREFPGRFHGGLTFLRRGKA